MLKRGYVDLPWGQVHMREAGSGEPVLLLHASPLHSGFVEPQIGRLSARFRAIGLDTPGYGQSSPLPRPAKDLADYARAILDAADGLGLARFRLYGTATGAQIALSVAKLAPSRIVRLALDNCAKFSAEARRDWPEQYFPDLSPSLDGEHLPRLWRLVERQFQYFPWHIASEETRLNLPAPPLERLNAMALAYLQAGPAYDAAYRLAFQAEDNASFQGLAVPAVLIDWAGSLVRREVRALIADGLPDCVTVREAGPSLEDRLEAIAAALA